MKKKFTLFKSTGCYSAKEWQEEEQAAKENLIDNGYSEEEIDEDMIREEVYHNEEYSWSDTMDNLYKKLDGSIVAIADLGFWNGRKSGYKVLGHNLNNVLTFFGCDYANIYATKRGVYGEFYHHDGTHYVEFREFKPNVNEERFLKKIYDNDFDRSDISRYTKSLAPYVRDIYGCLT